MRSRQTTTALAVAVGIAVALLGCSSSDTAPAPAPAPTPAPVPAPDPTPDPAPDAEDVVAVHLVRSAPTTFFLEPTPVEVPASGDAVSARVTAAIGALLELRATPDPELFTSVPEGTTLRGVRVDGGVATLDLSGAVVGSSGSSSQETTFAQQLAHTARVDPSITAIRVEIDGAAITELWGHLDWSQPIAPDPFLLSPVTVTTPLAGADVAVGPVTFGGEATVFEATVLVTLLDADGAVVEDGFVTATTGAPERGTWEWTVTLPAPGEYTIVAAESDPSGGEGRPPFAARRTVRAG